ncbi:MAG: hypothetical protein WBC44_19925 [Planctomycetaceae bacterium]
MLRRHFSCWLVTGAVLFGPASGNAQTKPLSAAEQVSAGLPTGTRAYSPGKWGLVEVRVVNRSDKPSTVLSSLFFDGHADRQYGREIWLPPRSRRITWHPVLVPESLPRGSETLSFNSVFIERTGSEERVVPTETGQMLNDGILPIDQEGRLTCRVEEMDPFVTDDAGDAVNDMIVAARFHAGLSRKVVSMRGLVLPPGAETLQGMEHLVLMGDRPLSDPAGMAAIRQWVYRGGRLWIVLNKVSPELVERLFGDVCRLQTVDRVGLTQVRIEGVGLAARSSDGENREFEKPVEMVRVLTDDLEVLHTVDGWPASLVRNVGQGQVLLTTVGAEAWTRPRRPGDVAPPDRLGETPFVAGEPLSYLSERVMGLQKAPVHTVDDWQPFLAEQIGYRIVGRGTVLAILGSFCVVLAVGAVWLGRRERLEWLGWAAPAVSLASASVLAILGLQNSESVPSTVAEGQLVETTPGSSVVQTTGLLTFYNQETTKAELGSTGGGLILPDMTGFSGTTRRMVWTDWDRWHWENLTLPAGIRVASFQKDLRLESPVAAQGAFGPDGFAGRVTGPLQNLSDPVMTAPSGGNVAPRLQANGKFVAGPDDVLAPGTFISSTLLSDNQRRRQGMYERLLHIDSGHGRYRERPTLLAWSPPLDLAFAYPPESSRTGASLVVFPVEIERTPPGTQVKIPSPFIQFDAVPRPTGGVSSSLYHDETGEWVEYTGNLESWQRFELPSEVVPLKLEKVEISLEASGAMERLELIGWNGMRAESLRVWEQPVGTLRATVDRADVLKLDDRGGLSLGLRVTGSPAPVDPDSGELRQYWLMKSLRLEASGQTHEAPSEP